MELFLAKYNHKGIQRTVAFNKAEFDQPKAEAWLNSKGIKNFFFFFEAYEPTQYDETTMLFKGEVGFDITADNLMAAINNGQNIIIDSYGGDLYESWKIYDRIRLSDKKPTIGVIGVCASAAIQILLAAETRWASENSRGLIHNPWQMAMGDDGEFEAIAAELKMEKNKLAAIYSKISERPVEEVLALMLEERFLTAEEMLQWNFITEIKTSPTITNNQNEAEMAENKELAEKVNKMEGVINSLKNLFTGKPDIKNIIVTDATGIQIDFPDLDEESQIVVGVKATIEGAPAEGEYVMAGGTIEGKTFVFTAGNLDEIIDPAGDGNEEMENLKQENADLKAELETLKGTNNKVQDQIKTLTAQVAEFKNMVTTGEPAPSTPPVIEGEKKFTYKRK